MDYLNLNSWLQKYLQEKKISHWTEVQKAVFRNFKKQTNIIAISPTGSGKTLAFALPILQNIDFNTKNYQAIIVCPTRELARQIHSVFLEITKFNPKLKTVLWIGGLDLNKLINNAQAHLGQIIVCTPKRFLEVSVNIPSVYFQHLKYFVLDEADMLLDLNFFSDIEKIVSQTKLTDQVIKIATSATLHQLLNDKIIKLFKNVTVVDCNNQDLVFNKINHHLIKTTDRFHALCVLLQTINPYFCLIFCNTNKTADKIYQKMLEMNYDVINLHSNLETRQRKNNYKSIKNLRHQYVVASDLASRGLDIDGASHVISYELPTDLQWYIHRAGRTGRGKYLGDSYVIYEPRDLEQYEKLLKNRFKFEVLSIKDNRLVKSHLRIQTKKPISLEQKNEIKLAILKSKKEVKPGYKKKLQDEINKINRKYKRRHIEAVVKKQRIQNYKNKRNK